MKQLSTIVLSLVLTACGSSGGGSSSAPDYGDNPTVGDFSGTYAASMEATNGECTNGAPISSVAGTMNYDVIQNGNIITVIDQSPMNVPGVRLIEGSDLQGHVAPDNSFVLNSIATFEYDNIPGIVTIQDNFTGVFGGSGFYGVRTGIIVYHDAGVSCTLITDMDGYIIN